MYIDLHCHTKKCKSGDSTKREISKEEFVKKIVDKRVKIVAITNHNCFDRKQYDNFSDNDDQFQVWPGVELDVIGESKGHCVVIASPKDVDYFTQITEKIFNGTTPDNFTISIDDFCSEFQNIELVVLAHFGQKKPALSENDVEKINNGFCGKKPVFIEVTNLLSAGIMIAHNYDTLIGSDVTNWDMYGTYVLPELKLPIDGFEKFQLLIKKNPEVIKSFVDQKLAENIEVSLFGDTPIKIPIYNDINVIFGGKGTGKSEILKKIKEHFDAAGNSGVASYFAHDKQASYSKISAITCDIDDFQLLCTNDCSEVFTSLKSWKQAEVTPITQYQKAVLTKDNNDLAKRFGFLKASFTEIITPSVFNNVLESYIELKLSIEKIISSDLERYLTQSEVENYKMISQKIIESMKLDVIDQFCKLKGLELELDTITSMKSICQTKSGVVSTPSGTGLLKMFETSTRIKNNVSTILQKIHLDKKVVRKKLGVLSDKGSIYIEKDISMNPDVLNGESTFYSTNMGISLLKQVRSKLVEIEKNSFTSQITSKLSELTSLLLSKNINDLKALFGVNGRVCKENGEKYKPSNGEESMLILNHSLLDDNKSVYILDEPEMSVGHKYINDIIVPRLKELSRLNKKVIVSTHDANIAIRTLPFVSIYREDEGGNSYRTYLGSPFLDDMLEVHNKDKRKNWPQTSIDTLEGGRAAFHERGEAYGKVRN